MRNMKKKKKNDDEPGKGFPPGLGLGHKESDGGGGGRQSADRREGQRNAIERRRAAGFPFRRTATRFHLFLLLFCLLFRLCVSAAASAELQMTIIARR